MLSSTRFVAAQLNNILYVVDDLIDTALFCVASLLFILLCLLFLRLFDSVAAQLNNILYVVDDLIDTALFCVVSLLFVCFVMFVVFASVQFSGRAIE